MYNYNYTSNQIAASSYDFTINAINQSQLKGAMSMALAYNVSTLSDLRQRVGDLRQIAGYQRVQLQEGRGRGNELLLVRNGSGLSFQISMFD